MRVDAPTEVLLACARDLGLLDLLVMTDCALHLEVCTPADVREVAASRRRGARALRRAVALPDGRFAGRADLWLVGTRTIHEYDGADHLARRQQQADLRRQRRLFEAGYQRRGYTSRDLLREPAGVLRDIDATLGRPHEPGRLRAWRARLGESLFTGHGKDRLLARLGVRC